MYTFTVKSPNVYPPSSSSEVDKEIEIIFDFYKTSGYINGEGFVRIVEDLIRLKNHNVVTKDKLNSSSIAKSLWSQIGRRINLKAFILAVKNDKPFDYITEEISMPLHETFLTFLADPNKILLDEIYPFVPSWEWKRIFPWQTIRRGCTIKMDFNGKFNSAQICNPLSLELFMTNAIHEDGKEIAAIRILLDRHDTVSVLLEKIRGNWPGLQNRAFKCPDIARLSFSKDGVPLQINSPTEKLNLFNKSAEFRVVVDQ